MSGKTFVRRRGTTPIPNATVHDDRLSYLALGLLTVILARPENAPQGYRALVGRGTGEKAVQVALRELGEAGYRHQFTTSGGGDKALRTDTVISEEPISRDDAEAWLKGEATLLTRAAGGAARGDLRKDPITPGHHVRRDTQREGSRRERAPHSPSDSKVSTSLRSVSPRDPSPNVRVECPHGMPDGLNLTRAGQPRCAICRREPKRTPPPDGLFDPAQRAAGEHLEHAS